jgi:hypothetical protein
MSALQVELFPSGFLHLQKIVVPFTQFAAANIIITMVWLNISTILRNVATQQFIS